MNEGVLEQFWDRVAKGVDVLYRKDAVVTPWVVDLERDQFQWYTKEGFHIFYDVAMAKVLLHRKPRHVQLLDVKSAEILLNPEVGVYVSPGKEVVVSVPVILTSQLLPIDGYHRIDAALRSDLAHLPCVILTQTETEMVEVWK